MGTMRTLIEAFETRQAGGARTRIYTERDFAMTLGADFFYASKDAGSDNVLGGFDDEDDLWSEAPKDAEAMGGVLKNDPKALRGVSWGQLPGVLKKWGIKVRSVAPGSKKHKRLMLQHKVHAPEEHTPYGYMPKGSED